MIKILWILVVIVIGWATSVQAEVQVYIPSGGGQITNNGNTYIPLPFDEEYKISLANKDATRRALVKITIDGQSVTSDGLILRAGEEVELERFLDSGSLSRGRKFKFIEKDDEVKTHRRSNPDDGKILVTVQYEQSKEPVVKYDRPEPVFHNAIPAINWLGVTSRFPYAKETYTINTTATLAQFDNLPGITVEGSESTQRFQAEKIGVLEGRVDTLAIYLTGYYKNAPVLLNR